MVRRKKKKVRRILGSDASVLQIYEFIGGVGAPGG
jgi:hypothetical protein